jgi:integrase
MALQTRNTGSRLFKYAIARQLTRFNPFAALDAEFIAQARSRDVALSLDEVGRLLRAIYKSSMRRAHKLALHLLVLTLGRKSEVISARWSEISFEEKLWAVPNNRMKMGKPHLIPLAPQVIAMLEELRNLAGDSPFVFPSRHSLERPIAASTLNVAVRALEHDVREFVIHDIRRTASTLLHEAGYPSDWIEKSLAHETGGVRGVYNRAQYLEQRRQMLVDWTNLVDSQLREEGKVIIGTFGKAFHAKG